MKVSNFITLMVFFSLAACSVYNKKSNELFNYPYEYSEEFEENFSDSLWGFFDEREISEKETK